MPELSNDIVIAVIGGFFTMVTAIITVLIKSRPARAETQPPAQQAAQQAAQPAATPRPQTGSAVGHLMTALFLGGLLAGAIALGQYILNDVPEIRSTGIAVVFGIALLLTMVFAWGDAAHSLIVRQLGVQLKVLGIYLGQKIGMILAYRDDCLTGAQPRQWFCPYMGPDLYLDIIVSGALLLALMAVIAAVVVEIFHAAR